jgi:hypothetical protein
LIHFNFLLLLKKIKNCHFNQSHEFPIPHLYSNTPTYNNNLSLSQNKTYFIFLSPLLKLLNFFLKTKEFPLFYNLNKAHLLIILPLVYIFHLYSINSFLISNLPLYKIFSLFFFSLTVKKKN